MTRLLLAGSLLSLAVTLHLRWTVVPGTSYRVYSAIGATPVVNGTWAPITPTPDVTPGILDGQVTVPGQPGDAVSVGVTAYDGSHESVLSNVLSEVVPTWTPTLTATAAATGTPTVTRTITATATATATSTSTAVPPPVLLDLSGDGTISAWDAALALDRDKAALAMCILQVDVGLRAAADCVGLVG